jgi:hypothetical protein
VIAAIYFPHISGGISLKSLIDFSSFLALIDVNSFFAAAALHSINRHRE